MIDRIAAAIEWLALWVADFADAHPAIAMMIGLFVAILIVGALETPVFAGVACY